MSYTDGKRITDRAGKPITVILILIMLFSVFLPTPDAVAAGDDLPLAVGSKGNHVQEVTQRLKELRYLKKSGVSKKYTDKTADAVKAFQRENGLPETGVVDQQTDSVLFSDKAVRMPWPTLEPIATPAPLPEPEWPARDAEGFLDGEDEYFYENPEEGRWVYLNRSLQITIRKGKDSSIPLEWFETEIITRNGEGFRTVMTDPEHPGKKYRFPYDIARSAGFVLGFSDDFYATRIDEKQTVGIIIREGQIIHSKTNKKTGHYLPNLDMLAQYPDGRFEVYLCTEHTAEELLEMGAVNVFSFGPILIRDGEINDLLYNYYRSTEPRQALGMIEPNHYFLLSVQGRMSSSKGTSLQRVAEMMKDHGVTQALNLDGGNTMSIIFRGKMLNKKATYRRRTFIRTVTSLIGIGYTEHFDDD